MTSPVRRILGQYAPAVIYYTALIVTLILAVVLGRS